MATTNDLLASANNLAGSYTFKPAGGSPEGSSVCATAGTTVNGLDGLAACTFPAANTPKMLNWVAVCPSNTTETVTFFESAADTIGYPVTLYDGRQSDKDTVYSYTGNTKKCIISRRFPRPLQ